LHLEGRRMGQSLTFLECFCYLRKHGTKDAKPDDEDLQPSSFVHHPLFISNFPK
jgi:hypothetical protein